MPAQMSRAPRLPGFRHVNYRKHSVSKLIVIGASTGGVTALRRLFSGLAVGIDVPVLVVQHIGSHPSRLPELLSESGLAVRHARHGERLGRGKFLVAPPGHHLLVEDHAVCLSNGPKEHHTRPAIDPLFRSAALAFGAEVIGVVMTGKLDDGTAGLQAIKSLGGLAVVQDPGDAEASEMPLSALEHCDVDHRVVLDDMAALLRRLVSTPGTAKPRPLEAAAPPAPALPPALGPEMAVMLGRGTPHAHLSEIGSPSAFACPDCQGVLWRINGSQPVRFRCHTGHAYTARTLDAAMRTASESSLWKTLRSLQERLMLLETIRRHERRGRHSADLASDIEVLKAQAAALRAAIEQQTRDDLSTVGH
jgi:two-component system, chemotaxis family, protein-glutamate methylesterase/glutaminase